jgi:signal transduction histidine kinase
MKIQFNSIRLKLTLFYTVILVLLLFAFHFIACMLFSAGLYSNLDDLVRVELEKNREFILQIEMADVSALLDEINSYSEYSVFIYDVVTSEITCSSEAVEEIKYALSGVTSVRVQIGQTLDTTYGKLLLCVAPLDVETEPDKLVGITRSADYIYDMVDTYKHTLYMTVPFVIIFALISGYLLSGYFLRQVKAINVTAEKIDPANMVDRIPVKSNDELGRLSKTLNSLFDRIHGYAERQKQFTADASHDLRSPLTIIKAEADVTLMRKRKPEEYIAAIKTMDDAADAMNDMVDDLLTLASMDSKPDIPADAACDLSACIENAINDWQAPFANKGVEIRRNIAPGIVVKGDPAHFRRIVDNLVKNAFENTPAGGSVTCSLSVSKENIIITVADTGTGIAEEHLPHIFDRFYRAERKTPGNGLGLPIVEGMVKMYGGNITVESELGKGTIFTIIITASKIRQAKIRT